jgi:starvation-inducible outer membrane lipoprotein
MHSKKLRLTALVLAMSLLTSCKTVPSDTSACPEPQAYSRTFMQQLAGEVMQLPDGTAIVVALNDYAKLRNEVRACR